MAWLIAQAIGVKHPALACVSQKVPRTMRWELVQEGKQCPPTRYSPDALFLNYTALLETTEKHDILYPGNWGYVCR